MVGEEFSERALEMHYLPVCCSLTREHSARGFVLPKGTLVDYPQACPPLHPLSVPISSSVPQTGFVHSSTHPSSPQVVSEHLLWVRPCCGPGGHGREPGKASSARCPRGWRSSGGRSPTGYQDTNQFFKRYFQVVMSVAGDKTGLESGRGLGEQGEISWHQGRGTLH